MKNISPEKLLESLYDGVYYVDTEKRITFWNKAAERITGYKRSEVIGLRCADNLLKHIDHEGRELCVDGCPLSETLLDGKDRESDIYLHHKQGHRIPVSVRISPVRDAAGNIVGGVEVFADLSTRIKILEELEKLKKEAYTDPLTKVGNRRYGEMNLSTRLYELTAFKVPFGVLFLDIDHFKTFNDTHGHKTGDDALIMVSKTIGNILRKLDAVCRWGGEEFVVILPNVGPQTLEKTAERIRVFIEKSFIMAGEEKICVTASIGGTLGKPDDTLESAVQRADALMYRSKKGGRNRVTIG